jgi:hypothetical protein
MFLPPTRIQLGGKNTSFNMYTVVQCTVGEVVFCIFNLLQLATDGKNNSKTKVEQVFYLIFKSSYAEMSFLKEKNHIKGPNHFFGNRSR